MYGLLVALARVVINYSGSNNLMNTHKAKEHIHSFIYDLKVSLPMSLLLSLIFILIR